MLTFASSLLYKFVFHLSCLIQTSETDLWNKSMHMEMKFPQGHPREIHWLPKILKSNTELVENASQGAHIIILKSQRVTHFV